MMWRFFEATASAGFDQNEFVFGRHMGAFGFTNPAMMWVFGLFWLITWILVIAALAALVRWLWKKGNK